jgi:hypothetical protein
MLLTVCLIVILMLIEDSSLKGCDAVSSGNYDTPYHSTRINFLVCLTLKMETLRCFEMSGNNHPKDTASHPRITAMRISDLI